MSAPIHNIRDGVIPAVAPAQVTEAHRKLVRAFSPAEYWRTPLENTAAQLIADSEAAAVEAVRVKLKEEIMRLKDWQNRGEYAERFNTALLTERDQLRARCDELIEEEATMSLAFQEQFARAETAEREVERLNDELVKLHGFADMENKARHRAERAEADLRPLVGAVESVICDTEGAVAHIFEREPGDKWRVQVALDRARQACATIPITKGDK